jgi:hypothetical protein
VTTYCTAGFVSDNPNEPELACDKADRFHLIHRDPATGVRYVWLGRKILALCGIGKRRKDCPFCAGGAQ